jgi:chloramphenicol-sensitive protein RarD
LKYGGQSSDVSGDKSTLHGVIAATGAFLAWSIFPVYFKLFEGISALEVLAHRIVWSLVVTVVLVAVTKRLRSVGVVLFNKKLLMNLALSGLMISINWGIFIWAVTHDHVLQSSLGYFINPLVNVLLGVLFLQERMKPWQWASVALAACGVMVQIFALGEVPIIALGVAFSFGFYGLLRKVTLVDSDVGLLVETAILAVPAVLFLLWLDWQGQGSFLRGDLTADGLLMSLGLATAAPLIFFTIAVRRLRLSTVGLFQYVIPVSHFVLAVMLYGEPFTLYHAITFALIWSALALYSWDGLRGRKLEKVSDL